MVANISRPELSTDRQQRRAYWHSQRDALSMEKRVLDSQGIAATVEDYVEHLVELGQLTDGAVIGGYWPIRSEPDLLPLMLRWQAERRFNLALPKVQGSGKPLLFVPWREGDLLREESFGARVPDVEAAQASTQLVLPDLMLIPCLAFAKTQLGVVRLGYGGGYYDRTLAAGRTSAAQARITIAIGFDECEDLSLTAQTHDQLLNVLITPQQCWNGSVVPTPLNR